MSKPAYAVQIYDLEEFSKTCFEDSASAQWTFCLCMSSSISDRCQSFRTHSCTHVAAAKVAAWCFTEQNMSLEVPVSSSHSCQADLRWQTVIQGEESSARCFTHLRLLAEL